MVLPTHVAQSAEVSDEELVRQSLQGDHGAFGTLVERHHRRIVGLIAHMIGDFHQAEDVAQEAFVRAFRSLDRLNDPRRFGGWVRAISGHVAIDWLRKRKSRPAEGPLVPLASRRRFATSRTLRKRQEKRDVHLVARQRPQEITGRVPRRQEERPLDHVG